MRRSAPSKINGKLRPQYLSYVRVHKINHRKTRLELLALAARPTPPMGIFPGLLINHEGGAGSRDRDILWLLKRGYIRMVRIAYGTGWARDISRPAPLRRTRAVATDAGRAVVAAGKFPT